MFRTQDINLEKKVWFSYLEHDIIELLRESLLLSKSVEKWEEKFHDYSFVVFPAAKAYEGFLKKLFLDLGFINKQEYYYKYFRIGKALNPELEPRFRKKESIYDRLVEYCGGDTLANHLWDTWRRCRNSLFHWFPEEKTVINFTQANENIFLIIDSIDHAFKECRVQK
jgi:hypothetical protein